MYMYMYVYVYVYIYTVIPSIYHHIVASKILTYHSSPIPYLVAWPHHIMVSFVSTFFSLHLFTDIPLTSDDVQGYVIRHTIKLINVIKVLAIIY